MQYDFFKVQFVSILKKIAWISEDNDYYAQFIMCLCKTKYYVTYYRYIDSNRNAYNLLKEQSFYTHNAYYIHEEINNITFIK